MLPLEQASSSASFASTASVGEPLSFRGAVLNLVKGYVGAGLLLLPRVAREVGLSVALPGLIVVAFFNMFGVTRFVVCKARADAPGGDHVYAKLHDGTDDWGLGPSAAVCAYAFGRPGLAVAAACIVAAQVGTLISYTDVIIETMVLSFGLPALAAQLGLLVLFVLLGFVRDLERVAVASAAGLGVYACFLYLLVADGSAELAEHGAAEALWAPRLDGLAQWLGVSIWAFEGINTAQFVYAAMELRDDPAPFLEAVQYAYGAGVVLYALVSFWGPLCYGDALKDLVYLNFGSGEFVQWAELALCAILLLTYPLQTVPLFSACERVSDRHGWLGRVAVPLVLVAVAAAFPRPTEVVRVVGALAFGMIGFVLPAAAHTRVFGAAPLDAGLNAALAGLGVLAIALTLLS